MSKIDRTDRCFCDYDRTAVALYEPSPGFLLPISAMPPAVQTLPATADRVLIAINPIAGRQKRKHLVDELVSRLQRAGLQVEQVPRLDELAAQANDYHRRGQLRALVGIGGDGTAAELVNRTMPGVPLMMIPAGTENLLARYLELPLRAVEATEIIRGGQVATLDAARAAERVFLLMAGIGFDAEVVQRMSKLRSGHIDRLSYAKPILSAMRNYHYPELRITAEVAPRQAGQPATVTRFARWAFVFNLPVYAGGLQLAPEADGADGLLNVCTFARGSTWHGLRYLAGVMFRCHQRLSDYCTERVRRVRIESEGQVPYQLDGDPGGLLPVDIEVLPGRLTSYAAARRIREWMVPAESQPTIGRSCEPAAE